MDKEKRNKVISFRLTETEFRSLKKEAEKLNIQTTKLARLKTTNKTIITEKAELIRALFLNLKQLKYLNNNVNQIAKYINYYKEIDKVAAGELIIQQEELKKLIENLNEIINKIKE